MLHTRIYNKPGLEEEEEKLLLQFPRHTVPQITGPMTLLAMQAKLEAQTHRKELLMMDVNLL